MYIYIYLQCLNNVLQIEAFLPQCPSITDQLTNECFRLVTKATSLVRLRQPSFYHKPQLDLPGMRTGAYLTQDGSSRGRECLSLLQKKSCCWVVSQWLKPSPLQVAPFSLRDSQAYWVKLLFFYVLRTSDVILKYVFPFLQLDFLVRW